MNLSPPPGVQGERVGLSIGIAKVRRVLHAIGAQIEVVVYHLTVRTYIRWSLSDSMLLSWLRLV